MWHTEGSNFLTVCIDFGLESYVLEQFSQGSPLVKWGRPILDYIVRPRFAGERPQTLEIGNRSPSINLLQRVLKMGCDPNEQ